MKVMICFATKYGFTQRCAGDLAARIRGESRLVNLDRDRRPDLSWPDVVLIGGPIYGGKIRGRIPAFCDAHMEELRAKRVGIFISCLSTGETADALLASSFPDWLYAHAFARAVLGGEVHREALTLFDRLLVRGISPGGADVSRVSTAAMEEMARAVSVQG